MDLSLLNETCQYAFEFAACHLSCIFMDGDEILLFNKDVWHRRAFLVVLCKSQNCPAIALLS